MEASYFPVLPKDASRREHCSAPVLLGVKAPSPFLDALVEATVTNQHGAIPHVPTS